MYNIANHQKTFPHAALTIQDNRLFGVWMIGAYYKRTAPYHGSYPPTFLKRVKSLFPDNTKILHLFSGMVKKEPGETTFDINPKLGPDVYGNAEELSRYFPSNFFNLVISDPPYSSKDAAIYGTKMPRTFKVMQELAKIVTIGGYVVWLCTSPPLYRKIEWDLKGIIGLHTGTNRVFRCVVIMQRRRDDS